MSRFRAILFLVFFTLLLPLFFIQFFRWQQTAAAAEATTVRLRTNIGVVADTTNSMGPELAAFSNAWQNADFGHSQAAVEPSSATGSITPASHCDPICPPLTATFHLVGFKDVAQYRGSTSDYTAFGQSLSNLDASEGGSCPDNALGGLLTMGKNLPTNKILPSDVVLLTDATPFGNRSNYVFAVNRMLRRGVNVHGLVSDWCPDAPIPEAALQFLTQATGGHYHRVVTTTDYYTDSLMVQDKLFTTDLLRSRTGNVSGGTPDDIPLVVDSTTAGVSLELTYRNCLTCPLIAPDQAPADLQAMTAPAVQIQLRDPDGTVIDTTTAGFDDLSTGVRQLLRLYPPLTAPLKTGDWDIRVSGNGSYDLTVAAQSKFHFAYLGPGTIPLGRPSFLSVALGATSGNLITIPLTSTFSLVPYEAGSGAAQPVALYDDGQHNDGAAGDGIYGGMLQPSAAGWWRLAAKGKLSDGTTFQRLAEVPLRVQPYSVTEPESTIVRTDTTRQITFTVQNETSSALVAAATTTFDLELFSEQGWTITDTVPASVTLAPGEAYTVTTSVVVPADASPGAVEESTFVAVDANDIDTSLTAVAETQVASSTVYLPVVIKS